MPGWSESKVCREAGTKLRSSGGGARFWRGEGGAGEVREHVNRGQ